MTKFELQQRTKAFHVNVIKLCNGFPRTAAGYETAKQLIRAAGSVGANYRAACRGKSKDDFIYKIEIVLEEADEALYWLEVARDTGMAALDDLNLLIIEANALVSIFNAADITAKKNRTPIKETKPVSKNGKNSEE